MKRWLALPGVAIVCGMLVWFASAGGDDPRSRDGRTRAVEGPRAPATDGAAAAPIVWPGDAPLPPADAPLRLVVGRLRERAEQGDAKAACRLAAEWTYCGHLNGQVDEKASLLQGLEDMAAGFESGTARTAGLLRADLERSLDLARGELDRAMRLRRHCEGVPAPRPDDVSRYWRRAALAGHLPSMRNYAVGNAFRRNEILRNLPALMVYRQEAVGIAERALARGDLATAIALAGAYSAGSERPTFLSQLLAPDAGKALSLLYRIRDAAERADPGTVHANVRRELSDSIAALSAGMRAETVRKAAAHAANAPPFDPGGRGFERVYSIQHGYVNDLPREACDAP